MDSQAAPEQLDRMITSYWLSQSLYAAAHFGLADHLAGGPCMVEDLARKTSTHVDALFRLMRALASVGVFAEGPARTFSLTPLAEPLRSDSPHSKRALALMTGGQQFLAWGDILYSIETGKPAFDKVHGKPIFDYLSEHPTDAAIFDAAMTGIHGRETSAILDAYDFSQTKVLADIGGGNGSTLASILLERPGLNGLLFDLPHVVARTTPKIEAAGLSNRCRLVAGSFFEEVPAGADAYFMRHIIHDWTDEQSLTILRNIRKVIPIDGRLLVVESVIPPGNEPFGGKLLDLTMLIIPGGKERTETEYRTLFEAAGFELRRIVPTTSEISIIEGVPR